MGNEASIYEGRKQRAPLDMSAAEFRTIGHRLVDQLAVFFESFDSRPVTGAESATAVRDLIGRGSLPATGQPADELVDTIMPLLRDHALHNGHPRFLGYITSSAAPLGALADFLAAALNSNCGLWELAPVASEIETQTVRWLSELIGFPQPCGGILASGGNMANFLAFTAARRAKAPWDVRRKGVCGDPRRLTVYGSRETHTWIEKAADVGGIGTDAIRWITTDADNRMRVDELEAQIEKDRRAGCMPFLVVGTAGNVSTGAIDPLADIAAICRQYDLWFHVDGAYGAPAAVLPEAPADLKALNQADSVALDPHKWLYAPLEAACTIVRDPEALRNAFSYTPPYYHVGDTDTSEEPGLDYHQHGFQNSRGFRALKVWLCLRQVGRSGYEQMIRDDIALAQHLMETVKTHRELEAGTQHLSITTFRYRPLDARTDHQGWADYLNRLNSRLLSSLKKNGEAYLSNALINDSQFLRACVVNFRTRVTDIEAVPRLVTGLGARLDADMRPSELR